MSRSQNSRKGTKKHRCKCFACRPKKVRLRVADETAKREGRAQDDSNRRDTLKKSYFCDYW